MKNRFTHTLMGYCKLIVYSLVLLTGTIQPVSAQTTLSQGDLSIVGVNSNAYASTNVNVGLAFVCWVDISASTVIKFTTNTFNSSSSSNTTNNANTLPNSTLYWTNNTGSTIAKGTVITIGGTAASNMLANMGSITYAALGSGGNGSSFGIGPAGRALFAYQGSDFSASSSNPATFFGTLLYGVTYAGSSGTSTWLTSGSATSNKSYQPSDLSNSYQINNLGASVRAAGYNGATTGFATLAALKAAVNNATNWTAGTATSSYVTFPTSFTIPSPNTAPTFTSGSSTLTVCQGSGANAISSLLTVSDADASQTETWSVNSSPSNGSLSGFNATASSGSTSITPTGLTYTPASGFSGNDAFVIRVSDGTATAYKTISVTVNTATLGSSSSNQTHNVTSSTSNYTDGSCNIITNLQPSGANPVTGSVTTKVWIESSVPVQAGQPYVARHYEITPAVNSTTATGTITLYFLQSEFNAFNAAPGSTLKLPTGPSDATGIANLRIGKYSGTSGNNSGLPSSYTHGAIVIDPTDANIVWNASASRWEVTFDVAGFSGFIVQTSTTILPVTWVSFTAEKVNETVLLKWQTATESNSSRFLIEHSTDGRNYTTVGAVQAAGNSSRLLSYQFVHSTPDNENNFYRLQQVDYDGHSLYSDVRMVNFNTGSSNMIILANPVRDGKLRVQLNKAANLVIYDACGQVQARRQTGAGSHTINVSQLQHGVYLLQAGSATRKFIIE